MSYTNCTDNFSAFKDFDMFLSCFDTGSVNGKIFINDDGYIIFRYTKDSYFDIDVIFKGYHHIDVEVGVNIGNYKHKRTVCADSCIIVNDRKETVYSSYQLNHLIINPILEEVKEIFYDDIGTNYEFASSLPNEYIDSTILYYFAKLHDYTKKLNDKDDCITEKISEIHAITEILDNLDIIKNNRKARENHGN